MLKSLLIELHRDWLDIFPEAIDCIGQDISSPWVSPPKMVLPTPVTLTRKELRQKISNCKHQAQEARSKVVSSKNKSEKIWYSLVEQWRIEDIQSYELDLRRLTPPKVDADLLARTEMARKRPLDCYIKVNYAGFAVCPFHDEKTGSFKYYPKTNSAYCFGCHWSGDVIKFIMDNNKVTFKQAIDILVPGF